MPFRCTHKTNFLSMFLPESTHEIFTSFTLRNYLSKEKTFFEIREYVFEKIDPKVPLRSTEHEKDSFFKGLKISYNQ